MRALPFRRREPMRPAAACAVAGGWRLAGARTRPAMGAAAPVVAAALCVGCVWLYGLIVFFPSFCLRQWRLSARPHWRQWAPTVEPPRAEPAIDSHKLSPRTPRQFPLLVHPPPIVRQTHNWPTTAPPVAARIGEATVGGSRAAPTARPPSAPTAPAGHGWWRSHLAPPRVEARQPPRPAARPAGDSRQAGRLPPPRTVPVGGFKAQFSGEGGGGRSREGADGGCGRPPLRHNKYCRPFPPQGSGGQHGPHRSVTPVRVQ